MSSASGHQKHISTSTEDEPDEWDQRIERGGCAKEHYKLQECYLDTKDWRKCKDEVCPWPSMTDIDGGIQGMLGSKDK
jgi:hypothetical protein